MMKNYTDKVVLISEHYFKCNLEFVLFVIYMAEISIKFPHAFSLTQFLFNKIKLLFELLLLSVAVDE